MSEKTMENCKIVSQEKIGTGIYSMWIQTEQIAACARAGQFVSVYCRDGSRILPRPISICEIDVQRRQLRLVYRVAGKGTEEFSKLHPGISVRVMGPLGNGFPLQKADGRRVLLVGGGIGVPPMLQTAKELTGRKALVMGYRDEELFLAEELKRYGTLYVATEDGSEGIKGNVLDAIRENDLQAEVIFACGPAPMLRALKAYAQEKGIECWISMEERMACGIGACLGCVCKSKEVDSHSHVHNKRICKDGPVFLSTEVEI